MLFFLIVLMMLGNYTGMSIFLSFLYGFCRAYGNYIKELKDMPKGTEDKTVYKHLIGSVIIAFVLAPAITYAFAYGWVQGLEIFKHWWNA